MLISVLETWLAGGVGALRSRAQLRRSPTAAAAVGSRVSFCAVIFDRLQEKRGGSAGQVRSVGSPSGSLY